jgi:hypothetical protein
MCESNGNKNIKTIAYNTNLQVLWVDYIDGNNQIDKSYSLDVFNDKLVTAGYTTNSLGEKKSIIKLFNSLNGNVIWNKTMNNNNNNTSSIAKDIIIENDGIYVGCENDNNYQFLCFKMNGDIAIKRNYNLSNYDQVQKIQKKGNQIYLSGIKDSTNNNKIASTIKLTIDKRDLTIFSDTAENIKYIKNFMIVRFDKNNIIKENIDNSRKESGVLSDFIKPDIINEMNTKTNIDWNKQKVFKLYRNIKTTDTLSLTRLGNTIRIDDFYASLIIYIDPLNDLKATIDSLNTLKPHIKYAELDYICELLNVPNDQYYPRQSSLFPTNATINVQDAWNYNVGADYVKVGINDGVIYRQHEDFNGPNYNVVTDGWDFVNNLDIYSAPTPPKSHGTACAGIVGAVRNNNIGIAGGNYDNNLNGVQLITLGTFSNSSSPTSIIVQGIVSGANDNNFGYGVH